LTSHAQARRRIGVLTFHRCINYGSYWQARCLVEGLRKRGEDAVLLDHESRAVTWAEWRCAFQPSLPERTPRSEYPSYRTKARKFLNAFEALPQSPRFPLHEPAAMEPVDTVVIGSDEVWNLSHPWYGGKSIFYGEGLRARQVVSYAASFGNYDAACGLDDHWATRLRGFSALAVRDENSRQLVHAATGEDPVLVLDPVLQFPPEVVPPAESAEPYVAVYGHGLPRWFWEQVKAWARGVGYRLVSIGYRNHWADEQRVSVGPEEFAQLIAGASAVVTNFFHGCVFALINDKPFASAPSSYRFNKVRDLTESLQAQRHLVREGVSVAELDALLGRPLDPGIGQAIAGLRAQSNRYLDRVLA
jgi:hypothetical protein